MQIPVDILEIHKKFIDAGKELFLVGGCVRDFKLGKNPKDLDMATNAYPEEIERILSGYSMDLTGKKFGVMRVRTEQSPFLGHEIATYREDETGGRKPIVKIGSTIENDAIRRDFTINAMYFDISNNKIVDLVGGEKDLENKIIRACGEASKRINDDALRIMRAIRFKNTLGGSLDEDLHKAIIDHPVLECPDPEGNIVPISQERISEEFLKGIKGAYNMDLVDEYVKDLISYQLIGQVFRGLHINESFTSYSKVPEILIADILLYNTDRKDLFNKLVYTCKFTKEIAEGVLFLLDLRNLDEDKAYKLKKRMIAKTNLTNEDLVEYGNIMSQDGLIKRIPYISAFIKYEIQTDGEVLKEKEGFKDGPELGIEIEKRERENFLKIYHGK